MEKNKSTVTSSSFIYRVLMSLHHLQGIPEFHQGVRLQDLTTYIKANCLTDGDIPSQVATALMHSLDLGYVRKFNNQYQVIVNSAKIQKVPCGSLEQTQEIARVHNIFSTNWLSGKSFQNYVQRERSLQILDNVNSDVPVHIEAEVNITHGSNTSTSSRKNKIRKTNKRPKRNGDISSNSSVATNTSADKNRQKKKMKMK